MIIGGVADKGRHADAANRHNRQISHHPFQPVFRNNDNTITGVNPARDQAGGDVAHLLGDLLIT